MPKITRDEMTNYLVEYFFDSPVECIDNEINDLARETKRKLKHKAEKKAEQATKEYLIKIYESFAGINLEKAPWFMRWLDTLNFQGHQMFLAKCYTCNGMGKHTMLLSDHFTICSRCEGTGELQFPPYCRRCGILLVCCRSSCR